jgi:CheY-like chemotaxis protein
MSSIESADSGYSSVARAASRAHFARAGKAAAERQPKALRVLLVDDQPSTLLLMRAIFERAAYRVVECLTGLKAIDALLTNKFDLMILDVNLSDMSGLDLLRAAAVASLPLPPVVGITAAPTSELVEQAERAGMWGVLPKPLSYEQLI